jgi:hypothetical protein
MEGQLWKQVYQIVMKIGNGRTIKRATFSDADIVQTYLWAVFNERPTKWACTKSHWPICYRRRRLPNPSTMCRRLQMPNVIQLLRDVETAITKSIPRSFIRWIDAKGLQVSNASGDKECGYGYAGGGMGKGYKLYAIADPRQGFINWMIAPMQHKESHAANRLIASTESEGYLVGDKAYDANHLHEAAAEKSIKLITPQRIHGGLGHRKHSRHRVEMLSRLQSPFIKTMLQNRVGIEHLFGQWTNISCGLKPLPSWVRGLARVENWVRAKLVIFNIWRKSYALKTL